jgi:plasmid maintenance system antidote protein VapI
MHIRAELCVRANELVRREMYRRGWTQKRIGREMGITEAEISKLLNGRRGWTFNLVERLKKVLGEDVRIFKG